MERNAPINGDPGDTVAMKNPMTGGVDFPEKMAANKFANTKELVLMMGDHVSQTSNSSRQTKSDSL